MPSFKIYEIWERADIFCIFSKGTRADAKEKNEKEVGNLSLSFRTRAGVYRPSPFALSYGLHFQSLKTFWSHWHILLWAPLYQRKASLKLYQLGTALQRRTTQLSTSFKMALEPHYSRVYRDRKLVAAYWYYNLPCRNSVLPASLWLGLCSVITRWEFLTRVLSSRLSYCKGLCMPDAWGCLLLSALLALSAWLLHSILTFVGMQLEPRHLKTHILFLNVTDQS